MSKQINLKSNETGNYNYSKFFETDKSESQYDSFSQFVDEKISKYREVYKEDVHSFNRAVIAKTIGIDSGTLTKIVNGRQATRKRDLIIALCFALKLSKYEANQALSLYLMAPLNSNNLRDLVIIHALYEGVSVKKLNDILEYHGFPTLNVDRCEKKDESRNIYYSSSSYEELSKEVKFYCTAGDDMLLSLHHRYDPEIIYDGYCSTMEIKKKDVGLKYQIIYKGYYEIWQETANGLKILYSDDDLNQKYENAKACTDNELSIEIEKLKEYTDRKARYVHSMCNDTVYYTYRLDAVKNENRELEIYGELFDFEHPERHEYFQIEISSSKCIFTKSNGSRFLSKYLGHSEWTKKYGMPVPSVIKSFSSFEEIQSEDGRDYFQTLLDRAKELLDQIRERKMFLENARAILKTNEIIEYFKVENELDCYPTDDPSTAIPHKESFIGTDGEPITIDDLYRAVELGIFSIDDLCAIRSRYGSLEGFLHIDILSKTDSL